MASKNEGFEGERVQKSKKHQPRNTILGRLVFIFSGKEKVPPAHHKTGKKDSEDSGGRSARVRPDSLTLQKYATMRRRDGRSASRPRK
jgi:hypothetical protein